MHKNMTGCQAEHNRAQNTNRARRAAFGGAIPALPGFGRASLARRARLVFCARRRWKNRQWAVKKAKLFSPRLAFFSISRF
jgi:hypothetical protein